MTLIARSTLSALKALSALAVLVVGLPVVLYRFGGSPLQGQMVTWSHFSRVLASRDDGTVLLEIIRACSWLAWLLFTACVVAEAQAAARGRRAPRLRLGGLQGAAAHLVALSTLAFTASPAVTLTASAIAASQPIQPRAGAPGNVGELTSRPGISREITTVDLYQRSTAAQAAGHLAPPAPSLVVQEAYAATATSVVTVRPGDCLWSLAHQYLGAGDRYPEIVKLNYGQEMTNGQVFRNPSLIEPGWHLLVPVRTTANQHQHATTGHHLGHSTADKYYRRRHAPATKHLSAHHLQENAAGEPSPTTTARTRSTSSVAEDRLAQTGIASGHAGNQTSASTNPSGSALPSAVTFLTGALAGAVLVNLARLRRIQRQYRRRGRRIALAADLQVLKAEQRLRAVAPVEHLETLRDALICLEANVLATGQELPDIVGLHVTPDVLEVLLAAPAIDGPPAPFVVSPGRLGMCWQLDLPATVTVRSGQGPAAGRGLAHPACHLLPGLITAGATSGGYLLLDLESMQVAGCDGPQDLIDRFITTIATELATGQWSGWYDLILVGCPELAGLGRAEHCPTFGEALDLLTARQASVAHRFAERGSSDVRKLRLAEPDDEGWGLTVVVSRAEPSAAQMARLLRLAEDGPGGIAALVAGDPESDDGRMAPTAMQLAPDPERPDGIIANVVPLQITVRPRALSAAEYDAIGSLLTTAADPDDVSQEEETYLAYEAPPWIPQAIQLSRPQPGADGEEYADDVSAPDAPVEQNLAAPRQAMWEPDLVPEHGWDLVQASTPEEPAAPDGDWPPGQGRAPADTWTPANGWVPHDAKPRRLDVSSSALEIRILGHFAISHGSGQLQPKQAELVLALALAAPAALSNSALCSMLGADPDHPKPSDAVRQIITRTRRRLGLAGDGQEYIIHAGNGQYVLHPEAVLDWSRFRALVKSGGAEDLRSALSLINGQPFTGGYFWWIDIPLIETVRAEIVDAAETLAEFELAIASPRAAAKAARAGLMAEPSAEQLWRIVMRAEHAAGNLAGVTEAWRRCLDAVAEIAPDGEPHPETATLYRQLTQSARQRVEVP
jgi:DNA-binding SARP family transcriptional activator